MRKTLLPLICLGTTLMAAATPVTPAYVPHNKVKGTTPTMTNIQEWAASIVAPGGEAKFTNDIRATADVGVHKVGPSGYVDLALSNKTLQAGMEYLVQSNRNPTVTYPSVKSMTLMDRYGSTVLAREVGTKFTPKYSIGVDTGTYEFGPKPTGVAFNEFKVYTVSNGVERLMSVTNQTATLSDGEFTVLDNTAFYVKARGHHTVGAVPSNNIGQAVPALQIPAGWYKSGSAPAATSDDATFVPSKLPAEGYYVSGYRNWYGIITNSLDGTVDSNYIRSDSSHSYGSAKISAQTYTKSVDVAAGTKRVVFAIPKPAYGNSYSKKITSIYDHVANQEVLQRFDSSVVSVEAASAQVQAMDYDVLIYENKNGITATRYTLTLSTVAISPPAVRSIRRDTSPTSEARSTSSYIEGAGVISPYYRQLYGPLDVSDVFYSEADLTYYCSTGGVTTGVSTYWRNKTPYPYAGQIVTLAADAAHPTNYVLKAKADGTYDKELIGSSGGGDVSDRITNLTNVITADGKWMTLTNAALNAWTTNDVATKAYADGKMSIGGFWYATGAVYINSLGNKVSFIVSFTPDAVSGNLIPHSVGYVDFRGLYASSELTPDGTYWTCSVYDWHRSTNHTIRIDIDQNPMDIYFDGVHIDGSSITTTLSRGTSYTTETGAIDINPNLWSAYALPIGTLEELLTETCSNRINACEGSLSSKADRVPSAAAGNFATFTSTGNLQDTGKKSSDFLSISGGTMDGIIIMNNQGIYLDGGTNYISYSDSIDRVTFGNDLAAKESCLKIDNTPVATYGSISNDFPIVTNAYTKGDADATFLGKTAKAADAEKLDGHASTEFAPQVEGGYLPRIAGISNHLTGELFFANTNCSISGNTDSGGVLSLSAESLHFIKPSVGAPSASYLEPDGTPVATSNMVEAIVAGRSGGIDESVLTNKALTAFGPSATDSVVGALRNTDVVLTVSNGVFAVKDHGATVWRSSSTAGGADENAVHYTPDSNWSDAEKAQARSNIGAAHEALLKRTLQEEVGGVDGTTTPSPFNWGWIVHHNNPVLSNGTVTSIKFQSGVVYPAYPIKFTVGVFSNDTDEGKLVLLRECAVENLTIEAGADVALPVSLAVAEGNVIGFSVDGTDFSGGERSALCRADGTEKAVQISGPASGQHTPGYEFSYIGQSLGTRKVPCLAKIEYDEYISTPSLDVRVTALEGNAAPKNYPTLIPGWTRHGDYATTNLPLGRVISNNSVLSYGGANLLYGKHVWIFGDSLNDADENGYHWVADWLEMIAGVKCTVFAKGGTLTYPNGVSNGQDRVMHAIAQQEEGLVDAPDIILYEDINDFSTNIVARDAKYGTLADKPWMLMQYADFFDTTYESHNAAEAEWNANFDTLVASVENKIAGTMARMKYIDEDDGNKVKYYVRYYYGTSDATEFATRSNWKYFFEYPKLTACYKGLIERLMAKYPTARMHILGFPLTTKVFPDPDRTLNPNYYFADGTLDIYGAKHTPGTRPYFQDELMGLLGDIAKLYGIGFINVSDKFQVNLVNIETWYDSDNVHPHKDTYKRWAEVIYKELIP